MPRSKTVEELKEQLVEYKQYESDGEAYPTCPRCNGNRYVSACTNPSDYRPVYEEFPCPFCVLTATMPVEDCIKWIREQIEDLGEDPDEDEGDPRTPAYGVAR